MPKIIFDDSVIISQGRDLLNSVVPQQCVCINWKTDGYHQTWVGIPDNYELLVDADGDIHISEKHEKYFTGKITVTPYIIREQAGGNKKVPQNYSEVTIRVENGKIAKDDLSLICSDRFGCLIDNAATRKAVEDCIRKEFYNGSIFRYYSGIDIKWERS